MFTLLVYLSQKTLKLREAKDQGCPDRPMLYASSPLLTSLLKSSKKKFVERTNDKPHTQVANVTSFIHNHKGAGIRSQAARLHEVVPRASKS